MKIRGKLFLEELSDKYLIENFKRIRDTLLESKITNGDFRFFEIAIPGAVTEFKYRHSLTFLPKDVIQTSLIGTGTLTWNYAKFDGTHINLSTDGPCTVRAFIGTYKEE